MLHSPGPCCRGSTGAVLSEDNNYIIEIHCRKGIQSTINDEIYPDLAALFPLSAGEDDGRIAFILSLVSLMVLPSKPLDPVAAMLSICMMYGAEFLK